MSAMKNFLEKNPGFESLSSEEKQQKIMQVMTNMSDPDRWKEIMETNFVGGSKYREHTLREYGKLHRSMKTKMVRGHRRQHIESATDPDEILNAKIKRNSESAKDVLSKYLPIDIKNLDIATTHRDRVLRGTLIVEPTMLNCVLSIIEDGNGDISLISFYNTQVTPTDQRYLDLLFAKGTKLIIVEPFFQQFNTGLAAIRVDDYENNVIYAKDRDIQVDAEGFKRQGNELFSKGLIKEAGDSYRKALSLASGSETIKLLLNISGTCHKIGEPALAVKYAHAALIIDPLSHKAKLRLNYAIESLGMGANDDTTHGRILEHIFNAKSFGHETIIHFKKGNAEQRKTISELKATGTKCFETENYAEALQWYLQAMAATEDVVPILLSNIAMVCLKEAQFLNAYLAATACTLIDPLSVKGHYRIIQSLIAMKELNHASRALEFVRKILDANSVAQFKPLEKEISYAKADINGNTMLALAMKNNTAKKDSFASGLKMKAMNETLQFAALMDPNLKELFDDRVPAFHLDFAREGKWPSRCDLRRAHQVVVDGYNAARLIKLHEIGLTCDDAFAKTDSETMKQRVRDLSDAQWWYSHPKIGSVKPLLGSEINFSPPVQYSFAYAPRSPLPLGDTHISIGFIDLGELLTCVEGSAQRVVNWHGYETSPYAIAKTLVIHEMIMNSCSVESIFQVWFSNTWRNMTNQEFKDTLMKILNDSDKYDLALPVVNVLKHWQQSRISIETSRNQWLDSHTTPCTSIANMLRYEDRSATISYLITGALPDLNDEEVGSTVMCSLPKGLGSLIPNESIFDMISIEDLQFVLSIQMNDIITGISKLFTRRIEVFSGLLRDRKIKVHLNFKKVIDRNDELLSKIKAQNPDTVSWANSFTDFVLASDFHKVARAISSPRTRHFLVSQEWPIQVYGTFIYDYADSEERKEIIERGIESVEADMTRSGQWKYFLSPPCSQAACTSQWFLIQKYLSNWVTKFMSSGQSATRAVVQKHLPFCPIHRTASTLLITYQYA